MKKLLITGEHVKLRNFSVHSRPSRPHRRQAFHSHSNRLRLYLEVHLQNMFQKECHEESVKECYSVTQSLIRPIFISLTPKMLCWNMPELYIGISLLFQWQNHSKIDKTKAIYILNQNFQYLISRHQFTENVLRIFHFPLKIPFTQRALLQFIKISY